MAYHILIKQSQWMRENYSNEYTENYDITIKAQHNIVHSLWAILYMWGVYGIMHGIMSPHMINSQFISIVMVLTHWGRVMHICVSKLTITDSDNGLSHGRRQAIIWTNAGIRLIGPLGTNFNEISIGIQTFSLKKMHLKMSSAKCRPFCLGLNVLNKTQPVAVGI